MRQSCVSGADNKNKRESSGAAEGERWGRRWGKLKTRGPGQLCIVAGVSDMILEFLGRRDLSRAD